MNTPIEFPKGSITMCGIDDFRDTMKPHHTVVTDLLEEDKDVLVHCVHGRDRTGGIVYMLLKMLGMTHKEIYKVMSEARPSQAEEWVSRLNRREMKYDKIIEEYINQERDRR